MIKLKPLILALGILCSLFSFGTEAETQIPPEKNPLKNWVLVDMTAKALAFCTEAGKSFEFYRVFYNNSELSYFEKTPYAAIKQVKGIMVRTKKGNVPLKGNSDEIKRLCEFFCKGISGVIKAPKKVVGDPNSYIDCHLFLSYLKNCKSSRTYIKGSSVFSQKSEAIFHPLSSTKELAPGDWLFMTKKDNTHSAMLLLATEEDEHLCVSKMGSGQVFFSSLNSLKKVYYGRKTKGLKYYKRTVSEEAKSTPFTFDVIGR